jgi:hypothetical protein
VLTRDEEGFGRAWDAYVEYADLLDNTKHQYVLEQVDALFRELDVIDDDIATTLQRLIAAIREIRDHRHAGAKGFLIPPYARIEFNDNGTISGTYADPLPLASAIVGSREPHWSLELRRPSQEAREQEENQLAETIVRLQVYASSFYYRAHRCLVKLGELPHLGNLRSPGVTIVRNQMVEHPEDDDDAVTRKWLHKWLMCFHSEGGPVFRTRTAFEDVGYAANRKEFLEAITTKLRQQVKELKDSLKKVHAN